MKCLSCDAEMLNHLVQTRRDCISYDLCESCGSLWLDAGELEKAAFQTAGDIEYCSRTRDEKTTGPARACPRCADTELSPVTFLGYTDLKLDRCHNCRGFWLDGGEYDLVNRELADLLPLEGEGFADFVNNVHVPYWHKRVVRMSSETDFEVDVPPIRHARLIGPTELPCPACDSKLGHYEVYGIEVEGCAKCKGVFADKDELRKLKDKADGDSWRTLRWMDDEVEAIEKSKATPSRRSCPKCPDAQMVSVIFGDSKVVLDWCPKCQGLWLDRDEFGAVLKHLRDKLTDMKSGQAAEELKSELKELWNGPEGKLSELLDVKSAIGALVNITIFEHPLLFKLCMKAQEAGRNSGL